MRANAFEPGRFYGRDDPRVKARRLDQLGSDDPSARFFQQRRAGPDKELDAARTGERWLAPLGLRNTRPDIAQQPCKQRDVNLLEGRRRWVDAPTVLAGNRRQLRMHVDPLANAAWTEKVIPELVGQFSIRLLVIDPVLHESPQLYERQEIAVVIGKPAVRVVGSILCFQRALARILHRQRRSDHEHLPQTLLLARSQQHASNPGIER